MDDTAAKLDQIEAVLRALSGGSDGVLEVRSRYSRDGDHTNPSHRWTTVVRIVEENDDTAPLSESESHVERPHPAGLRSWQRPTAPSWGERIAGLHDEVMARLAEFEKATAAAKAVRP